MKKIRLATLFSGYDSQALAMERLKHNQGGQFNYELVAWCEIEDAAIKAHNALFPQWSGRNLGDICKVDPNDVPDCDCLTYSFPCQDISNAGKQRGFEQGSGSRSSLLWECEKIIKAKKPQYLVMEYATPSAGPTTATGPRTYAEADTERASSTSTPISAASQRYRCQTEDNG